MAVIDLHIVDQAKVVDVDWNFRIVDFLERCDDSIMQVAAGFARRNRFGLLIEEAFRS